jgi:hypothetical protein
MPRRVGGHTCNCVSCLCLILGRVGLTKLKAWSGDAAYDSYNCFVISGNELLRSCKSYTLPCLLLRNNGLSFFN